MQLVRNIPSHAEVVPVNSGNLRQHLAIADEQVLILYQGGLGPSRALETLIEALPHAPQTTLVIRGPGMEHFSHAYATLARDLGVSDRLHLLPPVASQDVVAAAQGADLGIYTVAALCKSFTYALPNKVFEYLAAGLPVLTADYPEVRKLLVEGGVGLGFDAADALSIAAAMRRAGDPVLREKLKAAIPGLLAAHQADAEWQKLVTLYNALPRASA